LRIWPVFVAIFLAILLFGLVSVGYEVLSVRFFPTVVKEGEPVVITVSLNNFEPQPQVYRVSLYVNGLMVLSAEAPVEPMSAHLYTYTLASPRAGEALRVYAEALNVASGARHVKYLNVPQQPPELLMSFSAFSSFATSLSSTSSSSTSLTTLTYYLNTMGLSAEGGSVDSALNVGLVVSATLISLLLFLELSDPAYGGVGRRVLALRRRYGVLAAALLLIFAGIVLTKVVMVIVG